MAMMTVLYRGANDPLHMARVQKYSLAAHAFHGSESLRRFPET